MNAITVTLQFDGALLEVLDRIAAALERAREPQPLPKPSAGAPAPPPPAPAPEPRSESLGTKTPERVELVRRLWPAGGPAQDILRQFNALPGQKIGIRRLGVFAARIGVRRPVGFNSKAKPLSPEEQTAIERHIAEHGVTRLPAAAVEETTATISAADRAAIAAHGDPIREAIEARAEARRDNAVKRRANVIR